MVEAGPKVYFVLGGPGSGKGTQCFKLVETFSDIVHLSAGDLLREERQKGGETGELIEKHIKEGSIVPAEITTGLLKKAMQSRGWSAKRFLVDGFPRNQDNVNVWFQMVPEAQVQGVLFIDCPEQVCVQRILKRGQGRVDDNEETLKKRFQTYVTSTQPVIQSFAAQNKVMQVALDGTETVERVFEKVREFFQ